MDYRREIDGLRALAVLPAILFHAGFETFSGGFVGVDVFFVISGYLIATIILAELEQDKFSIVNFYERRARRILPALFLVMFVCIPFAWLWLLPSDMKDFSQSLVAVSVFASNFLFLRESGYFDTAAELKPLLHTWSLAVEEQYFVIFPLFLMLTWQQSGNNSLSCLTHQKGTARYGTNYGITERESLKTITRSSRPCSMQALMPIDDIGLIHSIKPNGHRRCLPQKSAIWLYSRCLLNTREIIEEILS